MKKSIRFIILAAAMLFGAGIASAQNQKFAYVDSDYIMSNIPEYNDAQETLNQLSARYEKEITELLAKVEQMYKSYQAESILLSDKEKHSREEAIIAKEQEAKAKQMEYFGPEGTLYSKRSELVEPIQEKVFNAINEIAKTRGYTFVFDLASGTSILYANDKVDISDDILDEVGKIMQTIRREDRKRADNTKSQNK